MAPGALRSDGEARRRLISLYERNRRSVVKIAQARDRGGNNAPTRRAPQRFVVSERRTRQVGFGRGGFQVQMNHRMRQRFRDSNVSRRGQQRFSGQNNGPLRYNNRNGNDRSRRGVNVRVAQRRNQPSKGGRRPQQQGNKRRQNNNTSKAPLSASDLDSQLDNYRAGGTGSAGGKKGGAKGAPTLESLDAALDAYKASA